MKRIAIIPATFALAAMVGACTDVIAPDVSEPLFRHGGEHMVPIKADFAFSPAADNVQVFCEGPFPGFFARNTSGAGKASHMGKTVVENAVVSCATDTDGATFATFTVIATSTLTGANGDAIFWNSTTVFDLVPFLTGASDFGALEIQGPITGGTGQFQGATGSLSGSGVANFLQGAGTFSLAGTISSVGSSKQ